MYLTFYGLREAPFNTTPDPRFLYWTPGHREALAQLIYGVEQRKGFVALTGEVGTGKTTLLHALVQRLSGSTVVAMVLNSALPFDGLLEYVLSDLGIVKSGESRAQRLIALNEFLIERRRAGQNTVVVFDEAQHLAPETLEQIRLLSNFETPSDKLLQIILVGQPELRSKLELPELRQLKQRIGLRCTIGPLSREQVGHYIRMRLRVAGARNLQLFTPGAVRRIAAYSGGIPRVVNIVCDHCLVLAYADQKRTIEEGTVGASIEYLEEGGSRPRRQWRPRRSRPLTRRQWTAAGVLAASLGGLVAVSFWADPLRAVWQDAGAYLLELLQAARGVSP